MTVIEVDNLTYYYPGSSKPALANISLKIDRGDFLLITGPSGSGKSTLVKTFNGIIPHLYGGRLEGKVSVKGKDTRYCTVAELSRTVGIVFQDPENQI
ncbi:MAG: energy-coupling factor ABC transporter ATP-binding protein, partial [Desulfurococcales archaeon ex4484_217_1]